LLFGSSAEFRSDTGIGFAYVSRGDGVMTQDGELSGVESLVSELIRVHFQPIVNMRDGSLFGYECLSRGPQGTELEDPEVLFREAMRRDLSFELERECQNRLLTELQNIPSGVCLFVNLEPHLLQSGEFVKLPLFLPIDRINPARVVVELTERHYALNGSELKKNVSFIRRLGFRVALDDIEQTFSNINCIAQLVPDFMKINQKLTRKLSSDGRSRDFLKVLNRTAAKTYSLIIAEGIETFDDCQELIDLEIGFGQGYFFGIPGPKMSYINTILPPCDLEQKDLEMEELAGLSREGSKIA
jgi:EAL domain-containing protein (putative c-di-GMP-specific phosphodiesterase class I)